MNRDGPSAAHLGCVIVQFDGCADLSGRPQHHVPGQLGDLGGPEPSFHRQQNDRAITGGVTGVAGEEQQVFDVLVQQDLCLFARHLSIHSTVP